MNKEINNLKFLLNLFAQSNNFLKMKLVTFVKPMKNQVRI